MSTDGAHFYHSCINSQQKLAENLLITGECQYLNEHWDQPVHVIFHLLFSCESLHSTYNCWYISPTIKLFWNFRKLGFFLAESPELENHISLLTTEMIRFNKVRKETIFQYYMCTYYNVFSFLFYVIKTPFTTNKARQIIDWYTQLRKQVTCIFNAPPWTSVPPFVLYFIDLDSKVSGLSSPVC